MHIFISAYTRKGGNAKASRIDISRLTFFLHYQLIRVIAYVDFRRQNLSTVQFPAPLKLIMLTLISKFRHDGAHHSCPLQLDICSWRSR